MNVLILMTLVAVAPAPSPHAVVPPSAPTGEARLDAAKATLKLQAPAQTKTAQATPPTNDEVAPLPAVESTGQPSEGIPLDDSVIGQPPPIFNAPKPAADGPENSEWVSPYREDGTVIDGATAWPTWVVAAAQVGIGTGIGLLFAPPALALISASTVLLPDTIFEGLGDTGLIVVSVLGVLGATSVLAPGVMAATQTLVGDWLSDQRSALAWPLLTSYVIAGSTLVTTAVSVSATVGALKNASRRGEQVDGVSAVVVSLLAPAVAGMVLTAIAPTVVYFIAGEDKRIGDDGRGLPGLLRPAHATNEIPPASPVVVRAEAPLPLTAPVRF